MMMMMIVNLLFAPKGHVEPTGTPVPPLDIYMTEPG